jgi:hypothetical protein
MAKNDTLTPTQKRGIAALLSERDVRSAAKATGIAERTLWRWMDDPTFRAELTRQEGAIIDQTTRGLLGMQDKALAAVLDVFTLAEEQARVNIADFISEEPKALTIGKGDQAKTFYIESGNLNWDEIRKRGHLVKKIAFNQYGPVLELYDSQAAAGLKLRTAQIALDYLLKLRELNTLEERVARLEEGTK